MVFRSRNTMVASAILFLIVVILLRLSGGFFAENAVRVIGSILGGSAKNIPLLDFHSVDLGWLNPSNWSMDSVASGVNGWLHHVIDTILPAFISTVNASAIAALIVRLKVVGGAVIGAKVAPAAL